MTFNNMTCNRMTWITRNPLKQGLNSGDPLYIDDIYLIV
jgi:hypothetical protein